MPEKCDTSDTKDGNKTYNLNHVDHNIVDSGRLLKITCNKESITY
jgi:hypothetical protein